MPRHNTWTSIRMGQVEIAADSEGAIHNMMGDKGRW